jgi:prevent-host-death family protein
MISATEMRRHFDEYMQRIKLGDVVVITKYGKPVAEFIPSQEIQKEQKLPHLQARKRRQEG